VTTLSWRPGWLTLACLVVAMIFPLWLSQLSTQVFRGADAKVYFAAASLDARGGNPNNAPELIKEGERLFNQPNGLHRGDPGSYYMAPYGMPRLFTRLSLPLIGLGAPAYYLIVLAAITLSCLLGLEALMSGMDWDRTRWLPRLFLLLSAPFAEDAFVGNVSAALFLAWAVAFLLVRRGRPLLAGLILSICLVKIPVGAPAAAALIACPPRPSGAKSTRYARRWLGAGLAAGTAGWLVLNVVVTGWEAIASWWSSLVGYGQALGAGPGATAYQLSEQAGLPSILLGHMSTPLAVAAAAVPVAGVMAFVWSHSRRTAAAAPPGAMTALALSGALLLSPYIHLNDLVLEALPLLIIASAPLKALGRITLVVWAVGTSLNLVVAVVEAQVHAPRQAGPAGSGLILAALAFAAVAEVAARRSGYSPASGSPQHALAPAAG
jgi:Glycosyltransferase family 87